MAGATSIERYFGYQHPHSDLTCQDWRSCANMYDQCRYALAFFKDHQFPFWQMTNANNLISTKNGYCFHKSGEVYVVYLKNGGNCRIDLIKTQGTFEQKWFTPRSGVIDGKSTFIRGGKTVDLGNPPVDGDQDWAALLRKKNNEY